MSIQLFSIIAFTVLLQFGSLGQIPIISDFNSMKEWNTDSIKLSEITNAFMDGGAETFYKVLYTSIKYPKIAQLNCKEGIALIWININDEGQSINIINKIGSEFDEEIRNGFNQLNKFWKKNAQNLSFQISIRFSINPEKEDLKQDLATLVFTSYQMGSLICDSECDYKTTEYLNEQVNNSIKYSDFESAILYLKELLRRFPFHKEYQKLYEETWEIIEK